MSDGEEADDEAGAAESRLCTAAIVRLERRSRGWIVTASSAGHPLPLLRRGSGRPESVGEAQMLLGVRRDADYRDAEIQVDSEAFLVCYTDGISESRTKGDFFGAEGVAAALVASPPPAASIADSILRSALAGRKPQDDAVVVVVGMS